MNRNVIDRNGKIIRYIRDGYYLGECDGYYMGESLESVTKEIFNPAGEHTQEEIKEMRNTAEQYIRDHLPDGLVWDGYNTLIIEATALDEQDDGNIEWVEKIDGESVGKLWSRITTEAIREARGLFNMK